MAIIEQHKISETKKLIKVSNSKVWQLRFKCASTGKWLTRSTKQTDLMKAIASNQEAEDSAILTFKAVFEQWEKLQPSTRKLKAYTNSLHSYALPTIGAIAIDRIKQKDVTRLTQERDKTFFDRYKRLPSKSVILNWNSALNAVFGYAIEQDLVHHTQAPKLTVNRQGVGAKRRLHFSDAQIEKLLHSEFWQLPSKNHKTTYLRAVLQPYIEFLLGSGIRHGTETDGLVFGDLGHGFAIQKSDGLEVTFTSITIRVGKVSLYTGDREAILRPEAEDAIKELGSIVGITGKTFKHSRILGTATTDRLQAVFKQLLQLENIDTSLGYSLYSLRHTYITRRILENRPVNLIAKQCGTSAEMIERNYSHLTPRMNAIELI